MTRLGAHPLTFPSPLSAKWGRYNTILIGIAFAITGHVVLIISALPPVIKDPDAAMGVFALAIVIIGIGTGGFKPNGEP